VKQASKIILGYRADARPFAFRDESGNAAGYAVALCQKIAEQVKAELGLSTLAVEWSPVTVGDQFRAVQENKIDLLCGVDETLSGRKDVDFSIPVFPGGIGALLRADASGRTAGGFVRSTILGADLARLARTSYRKNRFSRSSRVLRARHGWPANLTSFS
jgi:ABC-type amino acid transport substrate-binding protein